MQIDTRDLGGLHCRLVGGDGPSPRFRRPEPSADRNETAGREEDKVGSTPPGSETIGLAGSRAAAESPVPPRFAVVLCHGYGAPGDDLVSLATEVIRAAPEFGPRLRFVFPEAPLALSALGPWDSRAWWPLDESVLDAAIARGSPIETAREAPSEMPGLRETMYQLLADLERTEGIPVSHVVLGGFSQGAMLATDIALRLPASPAGLCVFSGTLLDADEWTRLAPARRDMPALLSHGRQDPLLSFRTSEALRDVLANAGVAVEFVPFDGPHTISPEGFTAFVAFLRAILGP
jgi:phospholipase/carboxylesterase